MLPETDLGSEVPLAEKKKEKKKVGWGAWGQAEQAEKQFLNNLLFILVGGLD